MANERQSPEGEPSAEDFERADAFIRQSLAQHDPSPERRRLLVEFRRAIAQTFQAERQMGASYASEGGG
jgi:hypothetical protein